MMIWNVNGSFDWSFVNDSFDWSRLRLWCRSYVIRRWIGMLEASGRARDRCAERI
jgi:hypothetical protein